MILANKIIQLRKKMGWSQEELAEKLNVSRQSVSKWESTQSIPDIDRIIQMSQIFGVSTDYLLKDDIDDMSGSAADTYEPSEKKHVSLEFANEYMEKSISSSRVVGIATDLCILSPVTLILLAGLSGDKSFGISENIAAAIGLGALFTLIAIAVAMFIINGAAMKKFEFLRTGELALDYGVEGIVRERKQKYEKTHTISVVIGVLLCLLGALPLILTAVMEMSATVIISCVCVLLAMIAVGVYLFIRFGTIYDSYRQLLQEEDYTIESKRVVRKSEVFSRIYWGLAVAIYLGWSFLTGNWRLTWIVWPIAGVLFGVYSAIMSLVAKEKNDNM